MGSDIFIFDRNRVRLNRNRAATHPPAPSDHNFLQLWAARALSERLDDIRRTFPMALCIGAVGSSVFQNHPKIENLVTIDLAEGALKKSTGLRIQADEEFLPFKPACLDLVVSPLVLHSVNDLPGTLLQIRRSLRPDGLFLSAMLGGETLYQLRQVMIDAEMSVRGGISPRIAPFADKPQTGDLMQRAGFSLPVVDSDVVNVTYDNLFKLMHDLRLMGEGNAIANRDKTIPPRSLFMEAARLYQERFSNPAGRITASFEIVFSIGWAPHESQQKPLKRGSATHSLADFLEK